MSHETKSDGGDGATCGEWGRGTIMELGRNQHSREHDKALGGKTKPNMWNDARCTYASLQYQHATAVALSVGQYIGVAPGEYIHLTLGEDTIDS